MYQRSHFLFREKELTFTLTLLIQVNMLMSFKNCPEEEVCPVPEEFRNELLTFHHDLWLTVVSLATFSRTYTVAVSYKDQYHLSMFADANI